MAKQEKQEKPKTEDVSTQIPQISPKLEKAKEELTKAEIIYYELVRQDMAGMTKEQKQEHQQACQTALAAKREAKRIVEDLKQGKI